MVHSALATVGQAFLLEAGHNGAQGFIGINGGTPTLGSGSSGIVNSDGNFLLGQAAVGASFFGSIGEALYYTRYLNAAERGEVIIYLKSKWGIA